jgi:hypothetical protein
MFTCVCVCVCVHVCTHTHTHAYIHTHIHMYICAYISIIYILVNIHAYRHIFIYNKYVCTNVCMYVCVYIYTRQGSVRKDDFADWTLSCIYVHTHIHTNIHAYIFVIYDRTCVSHIQHMTYTTHALLSRPCFWWRMTWKVCMLSSTHMRVANTLAGPHPAVTASSPMRFDANGVK